jgi:drug/metabolite transporter (DMT)-like permease
MTHKEVPLLQPEEERSGPVARSAAEERIRGLAYVFVAGVLYASAGLFTRGLPQDAWTLLAWRSLAGAICLMAFYAWETGRVSVRDYALGPAHWALVPIGAAATICYIFALKITTVANVMIVYATTPFVTAIVAYFWVGERPSRRMLIASSVALGGVAVMLAGGDASAGSLLGTALVLFMNLGFALSLVLARRSPEKSMTPVNALALLLAALVSFVAAPAGTVTPAALGLMLLFGVVTIGLALSLFMAGARRAPSSEVALIGISDVVIGPVMVWLVFRDNPGTAAEIGGAIVMAALFWNIWPEMAGAVARHRKRAAQAAGGVAGC